MRFSTSNFLVINMKNIFLKLSAVIALLSMLSACGRDLSSSMYTSDSTFSLTMEGTVIATRSVVVKENDKLGNNTGGMIAGGIGGAALGNAVGKGSGNTIATVGGALAGGLAGAVIQDKLSTNKGFEYIIKVDTSKIKDSYFEGNASMRNVIATAKLNGLVTVVQGADNPIAQGQKVYVIFSENRTRVIPAN
jgi:outer membrane lipoprotein SlyB